MASQIGHALSRVKEVEESMLHLQSAVWRDALIHSRDTAVLQAKFANDLRTMDKRTAERFASAVHFQQYSAEGSARFLHIFTAPVAQHREEQPHQESASGNGKPHKLDRTEIDHDSSRRHRKGSAVLVASSRYPEAFRGTRNVCRRWNLLARGHGGYCRAVSAHDQRCQAQQAFIPYENGHSGAST